VKADDDFVRSCDWIGDVLEFEDLGTAELRDT
jgi:hypothetical protein